MERSRIDLLLERLIWALVAAVLLGGPLATGLVRPQDFVVALWAVLAAVVLWIVRIWVSPEHRVYWPPVCHAVAAFMAYSAYCYIDAPIEYVARQEVLKVWVYGGLFLVFINNLHRQDASQGVAMCLIFLGMAVSLYAGYQFLSKSEMVWNFTRPAGYQGRASGTYINPNHLAGFLEMVLPMAVATLLAGRYSVTAKIFLGYAALVIAAGLMLTVSRGGWLSAGASLGFVLLFWMLQNQARWTPVVVLAAALMLVAGVGYSVARSSRMQEDRLSDVRRQNDVRLKLWPAAVAIWKDDIWFGGGPDHFDHRFRKYRAASDQLAGRPGRVHNDYLNTLADWGIIGAGIILWAVSVTAWGFVRGWRFLQRSASDASPSRRSNRAAIPLGAAGGLAAIFVHSFLDFNMHIPANAMLAVAWMAVLASYLRFSSDRHWLSGRWWVRLLFPVPLMVWCGFVGVQGLTLTREWRELAPAGAIHEQNPERLEFLKRANAVEPRNPRTAFEIGEHYWRESADGSTNYVAVAQQAMAWFEGAVLRNPLDPLALVRLGMCLDWVERHEEALSVFERAVELDPNGFNTVGHMGWHFFQVGEYAEARKWFERSRKLYWKDNTLADTYLRLIDRKLGPATTPSPQPVAPGPGPGPRQ